MDLTNFIKKPIEDYVKSVATVAAETAGAARQKDIEEVAGKAAKAIIKPYAIAGILLGGIPLLLGTLAMIRTRQPK